MVIHDDPEMPEEVPIVMKSLENAKKSYVLIQNHLHEHIATEEKVFAMSNHKEKSPGVSKHSVEEKVKRSKKNLKQNFISCSSSENNDENVHSITEIDPGDLEMLRKTYKQCKSVLNEMESKYGHLLDLESAGPSKNRSKHTENEYEEDTECRCSLNKKIVFDDEGKEVTIDSIQSHIVHICPKKPNQNAVMYSENKNIQIEYHNNGIELSNSLQELRDILQNPNIETTYRNQVIDKLKLIKQEHSNEIKFIKHSLVEKLKASSDELLDFKGSNLSVLTGYLY